VPSALRRDRPRQGPRFLLLRRQPVATGYFLFSSNVCNKVCNVSKKLQC
jgi:hypothetical protein